MLVERTSLTLRELLEGNVGADVIVNETPLSGAATKPEGLTYTATIVGLPERSSKELEATAPPGEGEKLPQKGSLILLKTAEGIKAVGIDRIQQVTFRGPSQGGRRQRRVPQPAAAQTRLGRTQARQGSRHGPAVSAKRHSLDPRYKFAIDGKGGVTVQLEATLINELADLDDVTANLVVGVPTFAFADTADPIGLGQTVAQLSPYFRRDAQTQYAFSNAIMSQTAGRMGERVEQAQPAGHDLGPEVGGSEKNEDLFIFTLQHVTLKKGQRMVVPVTSFDLKYQDVFTVDIGFAPPPEVWRNFNNQQQAEIAKLFLAPKAMHKIRLSNSSKYPITTAPALILKQGQAAEQVLGQGMTTYTSIGGSLDLPITTAVDILVKKSDKRDRAGAQCGQLGRHDLREDHPRRARSSSRITWPRPARIEVTRNVLGNATEADHDGKVEMLNIFEDDSLGPVTTYPSWWGWYSWPHWWTHFNGVAKVAWKLDLEPGESVDLKYTWNYYWR